jgi:hypothetical protein
MQIILSEFGGNRLIGKSEANLFFPYGSEVTSLVAILGY